MHYVLGYFKFISEIAKPLEALFSAKFLGQTSMNLRLSLQKMPLSSCKVFAQKTMQ
jgi:hypothetical protein